MEKPVRIGVMLGLRADYTERIRVGVRRYARPAKPWVFRYVRSDPRDADALLEWGASGIIAGVASEEVAERLLRTDIPVVNTSGRLPDCGLPTARPHSHAIGRMAAEHLLSKGFHRFAFCENIGVHLEKQRLAGFRERLAEAGHGCEVFAAEKQRRPSWWDLEKDLVDWLGGLQKPVALMAVNDDTGDRVLQMCLACGIRVPDDLAVVGVDNSETTCESTWPPMSSVAVPFEQIGFEAARWVDGMLQGTAPSGSLLELPPSHVVQRQSTDVVAVEDPEIAAAVKYIRDRLDEQIYVPDVVEQTGLGRRMFEIRFRQAVGCTPGTYITRLRMNLAERLLAETDQSIPDVAAGCGYTNATHLGVAFKKHAGESPTAYRRRFRLSQ